VQWLTAMQAQDYSGALTSVGLRTRARLRAEVVAALDTGAIVRSWPMRGTLHLTAAQDLSWMLRLLTPRVIRGSAARRRGLGLDEPQLERARELSIDALSGGRQMRRADLLATWDKAGLDPDGQRGVHVLRYLAMTGTLVFSPTAAGEQLVVLLAEWVPQPRDLERDQALCELAVRYFRSHGPATVVDLAAWSGLTAGDTRTAITLARPSLASLNITGTEHLLDPQTPERLAPHENTPKESSSCPASTSSCSATATAVPSSTPHGPPGSSRAATASSGPPSSAPAASWAPGPAPAEAHDRRSPRRP